jgi:acetyl-CoA C-acetyltransferase
MIHDGLWSTFTGQHMGESSDQVNAVLQISRQDQDAWAARSHQRAAAAWASGRFATEVAGVPVQGRAGETTVVERDEGIRPQTTYESLAELPPAFTPAGTITAGNASQLSDGAAAIVVMSAERAEALGVEPLAEILAYGMCADGFAYLHTVPAIALERRSRRPAWTCTTSACSRSTRPSPRSPCTPPACSAPACQQQKPAGVRLPACVKPKFVIL